MDSIGDKIDRLHELREQKRQLEEQIKDIGVQMGDLENMLMLDMENQGVTKLTSKKATVFVNESVKPQLEDWEAFMVRLLKGLGSP